ncbi:MAG: hypothetical protein ACOY37_13895 [Pseudomonadota bacterium]
MNKLDLLPERALDLASHAGDALRTLGPKASTLLSTGAKLGALKTGARVGLMAVRRHPVIAVATLAGAGLLWYAAKRRADRAHSGEGQAIEGTARRVDARRQGESTPATSGRRRASSGTRTRRASSGSRSRSTTESRTEH